MKKAVGYVTENVRKTKKREIIETKERENESKRERNDKHKQKQHVRREKKGLRYRNTDEGGQRGKE